MKIAYRRMSGAIGMSAEETGTRGLWWEKRRGLFGYLERRGHQITVANRWTKTSRAFAQNYPCTPVYGADVLMIEFGSSNASFYGADLTETQRMVEAFPGKIVFLCDDPDLPYLWKTVSPGAFDRWSVWMNAKFPVPFGGQPDAIRCYDFPISSILTVLTPSHLYQKDALVYIGRPGGRSASIKEIIASGASWRVYGKQKEWDGFGVSVFPAPDQPQRAAFYQGQIGSLVLADSKHKKLGWRTGRAYNAIMSGCPAVAELSHTALNCLKTYEHVSELTKVRQDWRDPKKRLADWQIQYDAVRADKAILDATIEAHGL